jgi:hypothetical protein
LATVVNPRKPIELRKDKHRRYPGEPGYKPPKRKQARKAGNGQPKRVSSVRTEIGPPACDFPSLGPGIWLWICEHLEIPEGPAVGEPFRLTDDQTEVLYRWYEIDEDGQFVYRRGAWQAAQGTGKSPLLAAVCLAELCGPVRFGGWKDGEPFGIEPAHALVQCAASSEQQSLNTYRLAQVMATDSDLELDAGVTRIDRCDGRGTLMPVTASAGSRHGARPSLVVLDETHLWSSLNRGHWLADTLRRNASKVGGRTFESTNAFRVGEDSVAERTYDAADGDGILYITRSVPRVEDMHDAEAVREALQIAYGDAATDRGGWVDLDRLVAEITDLGSDEDSMRRYFLNESTSGGPHAVRHRAVEDVGDRPGRGPRQGAWARLRRQPVT